MFKGGFMFEKLFSLYRKNPAYKRIRDQKKQKNPKKECVCLLPFRYKQIKHNIKLLDLIMSITKNNGCDDFK